jgi:hypothetical protein
VYGQRLCRAFWDESIRVVAAGIAVEATLSKGSEEKKEEHTEYSAGAASACWVCCGRGERRDLSLKSKSFTDPSMKLTPELLAQAPSHLNAVKERQLDLRG